VKTTVTTASWRSSLHANSFYLMAANVGNAAFGFLFWTAAARLYEPRDVGLAAAAVSAVGLLAVLATLGLDQAIVRFVPGAPDPQGVVNSSLTLGTAVALVLSLGFLAGLGVWSTALLPLRQHPLTAASLVTAAVSATAVGLLASAFLARRRAELGFVQSSVFNVTRLALALGFAVSGHVVGLIGAWALGLAAAAAWGLLGGLSRAFGETFRLRPALTRAALGDMPHFAFANYVAMVLWSAPALLLPILVASLAGPEAAAYFYIATAVGGLVAMVPWAVSASLFAHGSHDEGQLVRYAMESGRAILLLLVPAVAVLILLGDRVLLLFGRAYSSEGTRLLQILALSTLPLAVNFLFFGVRRVQRRMAGVVASTLGILIVTMGLSVLLLPRIGLVGAGVAWLVAQASVAAVILGRFARSR
jgi:O-antigen/teichoic acid export membrane protein